MTKTCVTGSMVRAMQQGETLFTAGRFSEAKPFYEDLPEGPFSCQKYFGLGRIAVLENRQDEAERCLRKAQTHCSTTRQPLAWLADLARRRGRFEAAAGHLRALGAEDAARGLEHLAERAPITEVAGTAELVLEEDGRLPIVKASLNGREGFFLVDSGAEEVVVDDKLAEGAGLEAIGRKQAAIFPGGRVAGFRRSVAGEIVLGDAVLSSVPVQVQPVREPFLRALGRHVDGIIGGSVLYRFHTTIDWVGRRLILTTGRSGSGGRDSVAFYLAGAYLPVVPVSINGSLRANVLIDTGLNGFAIAGSLNLIRSAGANIAQGRMVLGTGGGGSVPLMPVQLERISLGEIEVANPQAACMLQFPLAYRFGFHLSGLLGLAFFGDLASISLDFNDMTLSMVRRASPEKPEFSQRRIDG